MGGERRECLICDTVGRGGVEGVDLGHGGGGGAVKNND